MKIKNIAGGALYKDKQGYFTAAIRLNGKQIRSRVKTEAQARQWILSMELDRNTANALSSPQLNDAANALMLLRGREVTLTAVAKFYVEHCNIGRTTFGEALQEYLDRTRIRVGPHTLKGYTTMLTAFVNDIGKERKVGSFKRGDAMRWLDRWNDRPFSWLAYQRALSKFFAECVKMDYCSGNPFSNLDKPKTPPPKRQFLSVEEAEKALRSVASRQPRYIHFLTLGLFAGIRPVESVRLRAEHINLKTGYIHLSGDIVKSHSFKERIVKINDTLRAWFERYPFGDRPIPVDNIDFVDRVVRKCSQLDGWERTPDNLRHTFGTYEFARTGNSAETASMMGHSEAIAMKHYRGRVTPEEAERFFALLPSSVTA